MMVGLSSACVERGLFAQSSKEQVEIWRSMYVVEKYLEATDEIAGAAQRGRVNDVGLPLVAGST